MQENEDARGADEPEECAEWRGPPEKGETDDEQTGVQGLLRHDVVAHLHRLGSYQVNNHQKDILQGRTPAQVREGGGGFKLLLRTPLVNRSKSANEEPKGDEKQRVCESDLMEEEKEKARKK